MYCAASEARKTTDCATSFALPYRPSGMLEAICAFLSSLNTEVMSVSIKPGATTFTVMFLGPCSRASDLATPIKPALEAA